MNWVVTLKFKHVSMKSEAAASSIPFSTSTSTLTGCLREGAGLQPGQVGLTLCRADVRVFVQWQEAAASDRLQLSLLLLKWLELRLLNYLLPNAAQRAAGPPRYWPHPISTDLMTPQSLRPPLKQGSKVQVDVVKRRKQEIEPARQHSCSGFFSKFSSETSWYIIQLRLFYSKGRFHTNCFFFFFIIHFHFSSLRSNWNTRFCETLQTYLFIYLFHRNLSRQIIKNWFLSTSTAWTKNNSCLNDGGGLGAKSKKEDMHFTKKRNNKNNNNTISAMTVKNTQLAQKLNTISCRFTLEAVTDVRTVRSTMFSKVF